MNFTISTNQFLKTLMLVARAISSTTPLPSLAGILLNAEEKQLTLIASDSNISIRTILKNDDQNYQLSIAQEGSVVMNAHMLLAIIQKLNAPTVNFEIIDSSLVRISSGNTEYKINAMRAEEYPAISFDTEATPFTLPASLLCDIKESVAFSVSTDETRPALTGVNLHADGKTLRCAATDSFRLAAKTIPLDKELTFNIVIPAKYLDKVVASIEEIAEVSIALDKQKITFIFGNTTIAARLIDDAYPEISHLLPKSFQQELLINSRELQSGIDRTSILRFEGKNTVKLSISRNKLEMTALNQEIGSSREILEVKEYKGEDLTISCSGKFLADAVKVLRCPVVRLSFNGELRPIIITNPEDESLVLFVSPVRSYD